MLVQSTFYSCCESKPHENPHPLLCQIRSIPHFIALFYPILHLLSKSPQREECSQTSFLSCNPWFLLSCRQHFSLISEPSSLTTHTLLRDKLPYMKFWKISLLRLLQTKSHTVTFILILVSFLQDLESLTDLIDVSDNKYEVHGGKEKHQYAYPSKVVPF